MLTAESQEFVNQPSPFIDGLMRLLDWVLRPIVGLLYLLLVVIIPVDAFDFYVDPDAYIPVHHLDVTQPHWKWQYLQGNLILFTLALFGIILLISSIAKRQNRRLLITSRIITAVTILMIGVNFYQWAMTGFDH
jgi:hypothetical protein